MNKVKAQAEMPKELNDEIKRVITSEDEYTSLNSFLINASERYLGDVLIKRICDQIQQVKGCFLDTSEGISLAQSLLMVETPDDSITQEEVGQLVDNAIDKRIETVFATVAQSDKKVNYTVYQTARDLLLLLNYKHRYNTLTNAEYTIGENMRRGIYILSQELVTLIKMLEPVKGNSAIGMTIIELWSNNTEIAVPFTIKSMDKQEEYYGLLTEELVAMIHLIRTASAPGSAKLYAASIVASILEDCLGNTDLNYFTKIYRDKKDDNVLGYDPLAISEFAGKMLKEFPDPGIKPRVMFL